jgi:MHS family shikimate/dehydroshikimate transporter-like MFS transporter
VIRYQLSETPAFEAIRKIRQISKTPVLEALSQFRWETALAVGLKVTEVAWVGVLTVFAVSYLTKQLGMNQAFVLEAITLATFVELFAMPLAGWLSDRVGRKIIYIAGTLFSIVFAFPLFWLLETRDPTIVLLTIVVGVSCAQGIIFALHASFMPELFGTKVRYSGISLGFQVGAAIGGGLTPLVAAATVGWSGGATWPVSLMLTILGIITLVAVLQTRETAGRSMRV